MTIEAIPRATEFRPTLPVLPLIKTSGFTPLATTISARPVTVTSMVGLTAGVGLGVGVGVAVGVGVGVGPCTFNSMVAVAVEKSPNAAWVAVMVEVPTPTTIIVLPEIVATLMFDEVKSHGAGELVVGGTMGTLPIPYVDEIIGNGPRIVNVACAKEGAPTTRTDRISAKSTKR